MLFDAESDACKPPLPSLRFDWMRIIQETIRSSDGSDPSSNARKLVGLFLNFHANIKKWCSRAVVMFTRVVSHVLHTPKKKKKKKKRWSRAVVMFTHVVRSRPSYRKAKLVFCEGGGGRWFLEFVCGGIWNAAEFYRSWIPWIHCIIGAGMPSRKESSSVFLPHCLSGALSVRQIV